MEISRKSQACGRNVEIFLLHYLAVKEYFYLKVFLTLLYLDVISGDKRVFFFFSFMKK
jgi:hypothetical protein